MHKTPPSPNTQPKPRVDHNAEWDAPAQEPPRHHASDVRDRHLLDSLGRAISAPLLPQPEIPPPDDKR